MSGSPQRQIQRITNLREWFKELATEFDRTLPRIYRFNGKPPTGDARADAWSDCDRLVVTTGAALAKLEAVLRSAAVQRAKPRGRPKEKVDPRVGVPMFVDE